MPQLALFSQTRFAQAAQALLEKVSEAIFAGQVPSQPIEVVVAGGVAVHLYVGARVSMDLDMEFQARVLRPDASVAYVDEAGQVRAIHLDRAYTPSLGLMHEGYLERAHPTPFAAPGLVVRMLSPIDLAISKLGRWAGHDQADVRSLAEAGLLDADEFERLALEALSYFVGNTKPVEHNIREAVDIVRQFSSRESPTRDRGPDR